MQVLKTQLEAKQHGFADVVYLDAKHDKYLEEVSSCNIFTVKGKTIRTPALEVYCTPVQAAVLPLPSHLDRSRPIAATLTGALFVSAVFAE